MSGIDNPIKRLKPIPEKIARGIRAIIEKTREEDRLRELEAITKKEQEGIQKALSKLRASFSKQFESHKTEYLRADTPGPILSFIGSPSNFDVDRKYMKKAYPMFLAELKEVLTPISSSCSNGGFIYIDVSVVDSDKFDDIKVETNQ